MKYIKLIMVVMVILAIGVFTAQARIGVRVTSTKLLDAGKGGPTEKIFSVTVQNPGDEPGKIEIRGEDTSDWTLADQPGENQFAMQFSLDGGTNWTTITHSKTTLIPSLDGGQSQSFQLRFQSPTSVNPADLTAIQDMPIKVSVVPAAVIIFSDNFNAGQIDWTKWESNHPEYYSIENSTLKLSPAPTGNFEDTIRAKGNFYAVKRDFTFRVKFTSDQVCRVYLITREVSGMNYRIVGIETYANPFSHGFHYYNPGRSRIILMPSADIPKDVWLKVIFSKEDVGRWRFVIINEETSATLYDNTHTDVYEDSNNNIFFAAVKWYGVSPYFIDDFVVSEPQ